MYVLWREVRGRPAAWMGYDTMEEATKAMHEPAGDGDGPAWIEEYNYVQDVDSDPN